MIVEVPFRYEVEVLRGRRRHPDTVALRGVVSVDVREMSSMEAPVALRFPGEGARAEGATVPVVELRWDGACLYEPLLDDGAPASSGDFARSVSVGLSNRFGEGRAPQRTSPDMGDGVPFRVVSGDEGPRGEAVVARAADYLIVEGLVWRRCAEPSLRLVEHRQFAWSKVDWHGQCDIPASGWFRMDETEFLRVRLEDAAAHGAQVEPAPAIEVLVPDSVRLNIPERLAFCEARSQATSMGNRMSDADLDYCRAFFELRDRVATYGSALMADGNRFAEGSERLPPPDGGFELLESLKASIEADMRTFGGARDGSQARRIADAEARMSARANDLGAYLADFGVPR